MGGLILSDRQLALCSLLRLVCHLRRRLLCLIRYLVSRLLYLIGRCAGLVSTRSSGRRSLVGIVRVSRSQPDTPFIQRVAFLRAQLSTDSSAFCLCSRGYCNFCALPREFPRFTRSV